MVAEQATSLYERVAAVIRLGGAKVGLIIICPKAVKQTVSIVEYMTTKPATICTLLSFQFLLTLVTRARSSSVFDLPEVIRCATASLVCNLT